jgi:Na+-transporting methylmalonyl-CoA/oxaloacetate decarboxylase gamma subunit
MEEKIVEKIFDVIESRLGSLSETYNAHNGRATTIFGFGGIILSIAFSIYPIRGPVMGLFTLGIAFIFVSLSLSIIAIKSCKWLIDPDPRRLRDKYMKEEYKKVLEQLISNLIECYEYNSKKIKKKALMVDYGFYCMFAGLFFLALSILCKGVK